MAPVPSSSETKFTGNVAFYLFRSQYRTPVFLERNINAVLQRNEYILQKTGKQAGNVFEAAFVPETAPARRRRRKIDDIIDKLKHKVVMTRDINPILRIVVKSLSATLPSRDTSVVVPSSLGPPFKCTITLVLYAETSSDLYSSPRAELTRNSVICQAFVDPTRTYCAIEMSEPFHIKSSNFFIAETRTGKKGFTLAPKYTTELVLAPAERDSPWPPLQLPNTTIEGDRLGINIKAFVPNFPGDPRGNIFPAQYISGAGVDRRPSGPALCWLELDYGWSAPFSMAKPELIQHSLDSKRDLVILPPPSSTAVKKKAIARDARNSAIKVQYKFVDPDDDSASKELEFSMESYTCLICNRQNFAHSQRLAFHLLLCHDLFEYNFAGTSKTRHGKCKITLEPSTKLSEFTGDNKKKDERLFVWLQRNRPFNIRTLLSGHWGWLREKNAPAIAEIEDFREPVTIGPIDHIINCGELKRPPKKRYVVPVPKHFAPDQQVFMRSKTKRFVTPGELLSESDEDIDDDWIRMKHEETIDDYEDVQEMEKIMMKAWNKHLYEERPNGNSQVAASLVRFSRKHKTWLSEPLWLIEFWKMCLNFIQFGTIDTRTLKACVGIIKGGQWATEPSRTPGKTPRARKPRKTLDGVQPIASTPSKPIEVIDLSKDDDEDPTTTNNVVFAGVCKCKKPWKRPEMVACEGDDCKYGWFHLGCVGLTERPKQEPFFCEDCREV